MINFSRQSKHWLKGTVRMETVLSIAVEVEMGDVIMSLDFKSGYRHFYVHPKVCDYFLFRYNGRFYRCVEFPFGWGRSGYRV